MASRSKGTRYGTRRLLKKRDGRRVTITDKLRTFAIGSKAVLKLEPSVQGGMPFARFHGKVGKILSKRGNAFVVEIKDRDMTKQVIAGPEHLQAIKETAAPKTATKN